MGMATNDAFELGTALARFGLSRYEQYLIEHGFETWEDGDDDNGV